MTRVIRRRPVSKDDIVEAMNREVVPTVNENARALSALEALVQTGFGDPNGAVTGSPGYLYLNLSGGAGATLWVKESGVSTDTGWVAK